MGDADGDGLLRVSRFQRSAILACPESCAWTVTIVGGATTVG
jgi:hypothetical protein